MEYFIDDDLLQEEEQLIIYQLFHSQSLKNTQKHKINELILAIKNIESVKKKKILQYLNKNNIKLIDGINFLNENKKDISQIKKVQK